MNRKNATMAALAALSAALCACAPEAGSRSELLGKSSRPAEIKEQARGLVTVAGDVDNALLQAQLLRRTGDLNGAARMLSQLVLAAPDDARVLGEYGKTLAGLGRTDDALAFLEHAIELGPADWSYFSAQGVAFDQKAQYQAAQIAYARALILKPGEPTVLSNSALSRMQAGDIDGAETLLLQAAASGANFPRISSNLALVQSLKASRPKQASVPASQTQAAFAPVVPLEPRASAAVPAAATTAAGTPSVPAARLPIGLPILQ